MVSPADGMIYVIGGQASRLFRGNFIDSVWALNIASGCRNARVPVPTARRDRVAVTFDAKTCVAGGGGPGTLPLTDAPGMVCE